MEATEPVLRGGGKPRPAARPEVRVHRAFTAETVDPLGSPGLWSDFLPAPSLFPCHRALPTSCCHRSRAAPSDRTLCRAHGFQQPETLALAAPHPPGAAELPAGSKGSGFFGKPGTGAEAPRAGSFPPLRVLGSLPPPLAASRGENDCVREGEDAGFCPPLALVPGRGHLLGGRQPVAPSTPLLTSPSQAIDATWAS